MRSNLELYASANVSHLERILAEKAVQLEATHDHLVANLAMYQPPQPPPAAHSSSQYFCQR